MITPSTVFCLHQTFIEFKNNLNLTEELWKRISYQVEWGGGSNSSDSVFQIVTILWTKMTQKGQKCTKTAKIPPPLNPHFLKSVNFKKLVSISTLLFFFYLKASLKPSAVITLWTGFPFYDCAQHQSMRHKGDLTKNIFPYFSLNTILIF